MKKQSTIVSLISAALLLATTASADPYNPAERAIGGGLLGAGTGAVIGAIAGGGRGAGIGAAVGGGVGAITGAATRLRAHITATIDITSSIVPTETSSGFW